MAFYRSDAAPNPCRQATITRAEVVTMAVFVLLVVLGAFLWAVTKDQMALMKFGARSTPWPARKNRPAYLDIEEVLEAATRAAARTPEPWRPAAEPPWFPPYESADPLWDSDLDQRGI